MYPDTYYREHPELTLGAGTISFNDRKFSIVMGGNREPFGLDKKFLKDRKKGVKYYTYLNKQPVRNKIKITPHKFILWDRERKLIYRKVIENG
jgi:hypothetical protein